MSKIILHRALHEALNSATIKSVTLSYVLILAIRLLFDVPHKGLSAGALLNCMYILIFFICIPSRLEHGWWMKEKQWCHDYRNCMNERKDCGLTCTLVIALCLNTLPGNDHPPLAQIYVCYDFQMGSTATCFDHQVFIFKLLKYTKLTHERRN